MTWLEGPTRNDKPAGARLRELLERDEILRVPGSHNPFAALIAQREGFEALYISGGAVTTSLGLPDLGVMMLDELCFITRMVARATNSAVAATTAQVARIGSTSQPTKASQRIGCGGPGLGFSSISAMARNHPAR